MKNLEESKSMLTLNKVQIDKLFFERHSSSAFKIDFDEKLVFNHSIEQVEGNDFKVSLGISITSEGMYRIFAQISGFFTVSLESAMGKRLLENNTIAILFPYLRSQLTLLSSQPGFEPIILPVINVNALLNNEAE